MLKAVLIKRLSKDGKPYYKLEVYIIDSNGLEYLLKSDYVKGLELGMCQVMGVPYEVK